MPPPDTTSGSPNGHLSARAPAALALDHISLAFGGVRALTDVSLEVRTGEIRSIIGPNGAGKSSLLNVISGVYQPQSGAVYIDGVPYPRIDPARLAAIGIARTFQNLALFDGLSVLDNIAIARSPRGGGDLLSQFLALPEARRAARKAREEADDLVQFFGLETYRHRRVGSLPYGARKRVELARALIARPRLLLLDEPMAGMNHQDKHDMTQFIRSARDRFSTTVILIEHDLSVVMNLSDRIAVLDFGNKIADGTPTDVRTNDAVIAAYLGVDHDHPQGVTQS
ncbi:ABC transporter ATP-binding protein [Cyanobium sp. FGCU-6]|nr:ABC transporter ATP-binding protein [Cyanobium sp. FGCU6]